MLYWWYGGRTDLNNLVLLCQRHHVAHHDGAFRIINLGHGAFRFQTPTGTDLTHPIPHTDPHHMPPLHTEHADIPGNAITSEWDGQRLQHHYAISVLAERRYQASRWGDTAS